MFGDGTTRRDYTYIDDIIQGVRAAIDYDQSNHEIFNLGESQTIELKDLIKLFKNLGKKAIIEQKPMQPGDVPCTFADIFQITQIIKLQSANKNRAGNSEIR